MGIEFTGKKILIISPQPFEGLLVSKQHYAIELAGKRNEVYFLEPPVTEAKQNVQVRQLGNFPGIKVIQYKPFFNLNLRFHARVVFDRLMSLQVKKLLRSVGVKFDIVWSFDTNLYANLSWFQAPIKIYHVVDPVKFSYQYRLGSTANVIIGVSEKILRSFPQNGVPKFFINHGIAGSYFEMAKQRLESGISYQKSAVVRTGYIGNLLRGPLNYTVIKRIIAENPSHEFHFWGNDQINSDSNVEATSFIDFLRGSHNVFLHGLKKPSELVRELGKMDSFLLSYRFVDGESDQSNSHKILEYLSTGKVLISSFVETYRNMQPTIYMTDENRDDDLVSLYKQVTTQLDYVNSAAHQEERIKLALANHYSAHINKIENLVNNL